MYKFLGRTSRILRLLIHQLEVNVGGPVELNNA
jgi:hypothetical protein